MTVEGIGIKPIYPININRYYVRFTGREIDEERNLLFFKDGQVLRIKSIVLWINAKTTTVDQYVLEGYFFPDEESYHMIPWGIKTPWGIPDTRVFIYLKSFHRIYFVDLINCSSSPASYLLETGLVWLLSYLWKEYQVLPEEILNPKKYDIYKFEEIVKSEHFYEVFEISFENCVFCGSSSRVFSEKIFPFKIKDRFFTYRICEKCEKIFIYLLRGLEKFKCLYW